MVSIDCCKSGALQMLFILFLSSSFFFLACAQKLQSPGAPQNLRCEYQSTPLGIDASQPRLSWLVNDTRRGAVQSAYQILVASSEKMLEQDKGDIWDSGKVESDQSAHIPYGGPPLKSRTRYYWKVRTWDGDSHPLPYSKTSWWEMGLLHADDWQAQWIGKQIVKKEPEPESWEWGYWIWHPTQIGVDKPVYLRKTFKLPKKKNIKSALVRTTADNKFTAFLNGKKVGSGNSWQKIYEYDVKDFLQPGKNIIAVEAANTLGQVCGFIFSLKVEFDDGSQYVINSDKTWRTFDQQQKNWEQRDFADNKWRRVKVLAKFGKGDWGDIDPTHTYDPPRSVMVRKEFSSPQTIKRARVYVTGLGNYVLHINGTRVGDDIFTPGWTDYPTRIQYQTYDVTSLVRKGNNAVAAILGNMWWSGGLGWKGADVYSEGPLRFFMQLVLEYDDGSTERIVTDESWQTHDSPILENHIYHGETYDARLEMPGWDEPGFDGAGWEPVIVLEKEPAKLVAQQGPTIQVTQEFKPVAITEPTPGVFVFDLGQNMVGWARLKVKGEAGTTVTLRFAEVLKEDGNIYTENLRAAKATDVYTLKGNGTEVWEPRFTYHGFRYVEVTGYPGKPGKQAITGRVVHSNAPSIGEFVCSQELLNKVESNINWGLRGNMMSVPTDCPQRDERLGWMGDAQIFAPTACYNRNMARFFNKWLRDIIDCQEDDGAVYDVNPAIVVSGPAKPGWGDAVVVVPWVVYNFYGDKRIIEESYDGMAAWVNYMKNHAKGYIYAQDGYGDWVAVVKSPSKPIGAAYFYYSTKLLAKMATIISKDDDAHKYENLASKIAEAFNRKYLDKKTYQYEGGTQTANLLPLAFGITPVDIADKVIANVAKDVKERDIHLTTGFLGTAYLLPMLSQYGYHDLAYQVAVQKTYPSWGYMVEKGATTIWELWNSDTQGPGMNSRNHFALGSVGEWYYGYLGGLRSHPEAPGFKRIIVAPMPAGDLTWAKSTVNSVYGTVASNWKKGKDQFTLNITIPANTSAVVYLPVGDKEKPTIMEGEHILVKQGEDVVSSSTGIELKSLDKDTAVFYVGAGEYEFVVKD